jgi:hypothetical protein
MRKLFLLAVVCLFAAACSDDPTAPAHVVPAVQMSHVGGEPAASDLCGGLSPCDAFDYDRDGNGAPDGLTGAPGICFLPPTVDNHLSDPACSGDALPGLSAMFQLAWCQVSYPGTDGSQPPSIVRCQDPADWQDLVQDGDFYTASVQWRRSDARVGDVFRLYVVRGDRHFAHRDVIIDPNQTHPADDFLSSIGYGTQPIKVRITEAFACVYFDTQGGTPENAATCLIDGATSFTFETDELTTTFDFPDGNPTFFADFEVSECLSLGFALDGLGGIAGNALVDTPLADCKISLSSEELETLPVPAQISVTLSDERWDDASPTAPFRDARLNVLQYDEFGIGALPPSEPPVPNWFGTASSSSAFLRWIDRGLGALAALFTPEPVYAAVRGGWDFTRMSDFQVAVMPVMTHGVTGVACASGLASCLDLGAFTGSAAVPVAVEVSAPPREGSAFLAVPDTRLHFFPESGSVACPAGTAGPLDAYGRGCYPAGSNDMSTTPPSTWDHLVVVTGLDGRGMVDWTLAAGDNRLHVSACGVARPGANEPNPPGEPGSDGVWGELGDCSDRRISMTAAGAYDNGPADGFTPFEPVDVLNEVAVYGLPLTFEASVCPSIVIDGRKGDATGTAEWEACATKTGFAAPLKGAKGSENAWLYTYNDDEALYVALEVLNNELGNKIWFQFVEGFAGGDGVAAAGDDILLIDFGAPAASNDWHFTQACVGNNSSSLCGEVDVRGDGAGLGAQSAALLGGAGTGRVFYEFERPLGSPNAIGPNKEDLAASVGQQLGLVLQVTQGQGGGKGGFVYPDPQTSPVKYHPFTVE